MISILYAILLFGFLIFIHECGHFLFARLFHVTVKEFSLGMGPKLVSRTSKKSGIRYSWRLFPVGGFVSMAGEDEDSEDPNALFRKPVWQRMIITAAGGVVNILFGILVMAILVMSTSDRLASNRVAIFTDGGTIYSTDGNPVYGHLYRVYDKDGNVLVGEDGDEIYGSMTTLDSGKTIVSLVRLDREKLSFYACDQAGQRVSAAVSFTNVQSPEDPLYQFSDGSEAPFSKVEVLSEFRWGLDGEESFLKSGDTIISVNGRNVHIYTDMSYEILHSAFRKEDLRSVEWTNEKGEPQTVYYVCTDLKVIRDGETVTLNNVVFGTSVSSGIVYGDPMFLVLREEASFGTVMKHAWYQSVSTIKMIWESLGDVLRGRYGISAVSGPVGVTKTLADAAKSGVYQFFYLAVALSMNVGIMNLLPLPALDGGRLFFLLIELIFRKPVNRNVEAMIHFVGIVLLMLLMLLVSIKDVVGFF